MIFEVLKLGLGLYFLLKGSGILVKKSFILAERLQVNPFFIGVLVLGMGTSAPEWAVSSFAALKGLPNLALGNIFGSNIFNILLVLGLLLLRPLAAHKIQLIKKDVLFLSISGFLLIPIMSDSFISRWEASLLTLIFGAYILSLFIFRKKAPEESVVSLGSTYLPPLSKEMLFIFLSFGLLIVGSHLSIMGASGLGRSIGMSERLIGIIILSVGTSLPELFSSITALLKNHKDMAVGNIIGSNIFNTFAIFGTAGLILPIPLEKEMLKIDLPALLLIHLALLLIIFCKFKIVHRVLPYLFFGSYVVYLFHLFK